MGSASCRCASSSWMGRLMVHVLAPALLALGTAVAGGIDRASARVSAEGAAGWSVGPAAPEEDAIPCTLQRLETLDAETFATKYAGKRPFILSAGGVNGTLSQHAGRWERTKFLAEFGNTEVPLGKPRSREAVRIDHTARLHDYVDSLRAPADAANDACQEDGEGSLYLFDRGEFFDRNPGVAWEQPSFLPGDPRANNQAWRGVFALGAKGTGFPFHLHGDAWLEVLAGTKRWAIYSMAEVGTPPGGYAEARPHGAWQNEVYPDLLTGKQRGPMPLECVQRPGEVVYVPHGWFHAVSNLRDGATLAVGAQVLTGGQRPGQRDPSQYYGPQLHLVQLQERLRSLEEADGPGSGTGTTNVVAEVVASLRVLLEKHPRLDGCALSLWKAHVLASGGDSEKAAQNPEAVHALRLAAETNPRSVRTQLTLAVHLLTAASKARDGQERVGAHREALSRLEFAWASDPEGYEAPALLCRVLGQMTLAQPRSGKRDISPNSWGKLGTVCARAKQAMERIIASGPVQAADPGPPAALLEEVNQHLAAVFERADTHTVALMSSVASGDAKWCINKRSYQDSLTPPPPHNLSAEHKGRKGRRKQRKQEL